MKPKEGLWKRIRSRLRRKPLLQSGLAGRLKKLGCIFPVQAARDELDREGVPFYDTDLFHALEQDIY